MDEYKSGFCRPIRLPNKLMPILSIWFHRTLNVFVYNCLPSAKVCVPSSTDMVTLSRRRLVRCNARLNLISELLERCSALGSADVVEFK
jgi:hypothetical protein